MASIIKIKRGNFADLPSGGTTPGELRFCVDTGQLFIDDGTDNVEITGGGGGGGDAQTSDPLSQFAATTSAQLASVLTDETGSGVVVFGTSPSLTTPVIVTKINPSTNDGAALGDTTHQWSDLFLAAGSILNFDNGTVTLTHASNRLDLAPAGAVFRISASGGLEFSSDTAITRVSAGVIAVSGATVLTTASTVAIANGGTNATSQTSGGVVYSDGTKLTSGSVLKFDGTNLGIGATPDSLLTVSKQTTIVAPTSGVSAHFIGLDGNPLRVQFDTHNNSSTSGTALFGRRSRGTASSPSAVQSGDTLYSLNTIGYGATGYAAASTGLISFKAAQNFTDSAMGTDVVISTTPLGSVTAAETARFTATGVTGLRIVPRVGTTTSSATPSINTDLYDAYSITALAAAITSMSSGLSGTPNNFDKLTIRIKDNGTARAITWGASFSANGATLPTTTVISKILTVGFIYNGSTWGCVATAQEA